MVSRISLLSRKRDGSWGRMLIVDISVVVGVIGDREGEENGLSLRTQ